MQYSKFWKMGSSQNSERKKAQVSSRTGMLILYTPAFLAGAASLIFLPLEDLRFSLVRLALAIHFGKRVLEVLFVHKFSGGMDVEAAMAISFSYFLSTSTMIYAQYLTNGSPEPPVELSPAGIMLFLIGICGNFYHHYLLSNLRAKGEKGYKLPQGGLFHLVLCPHYLFEIIDFFGLAFISQTLYAFSLAFGTLLYLTGRSIATMKWYESKFDDFPRNIKALVPYLF